MRKNDEKSIRCVQSEYNVQDISYIWFFFFFPDGSSNQGLNMKKFEIVQIAL